MNGNTNIGPIKKVLLYVLGYFALIVMAIFHDIGKNKGLK